MKPKQPITDEKGCCGPSSGSGHVKSVHVYPGLTWRSNGMVVASRPFVDNDIKIPAGQTEQNIVTGLGRGEMNLSSMSPGPTSN
jgi:hypothetical protein